MKAIMIVAVFSLAGAVCFGQHGHGGGAGHMGGPPAGVEGPMQRSHAGQMEPGTEPISRQPHGQLESQRRSPEQLLDQNSKLTSQLQKLLPAGVTPQQACSGFSNLGRCTAAIHVSNNLGIPFSNLKDKITGPDSESLGKAIHELAPNVNAKAEKKKAQREAKSDLRHRHD